jgi:hypothetical protein
MFWSRSGGFGGLGGRIFFGLYMRHVTWFVRSNALHLFCGALAAQRLHARAVGSER